MKLIFCIDDKGGMAFNKRRVSRDRLLIENLAEYVGDGTLFLDPYSAELFSEVSLNIICSADPCASAGEGEFVFLETKSPAPHASLAEELVIYKWNRRYPFDVQMGFVPEKLGFKLKACLEFKGNSHEKITREVYVK